MRIDPPDASTPQTAQFDGLHDEIIGEQWDAGQNCE